MKTLTKSESSKPGQSSRSNQDQGSWLWLTEADVVSLVDIDDTIDGLEAGLATLGRGGAKNIPKALGVWGDGSSVHSLGSINMHAGYTGFKTWANTKKGANALFTLFSSEDGSIKAVFEAAALGSLRTSAISGLATRWLAPTQADELAIIGTGRQALTQVAAVDAVRPLRRVRVYSPRAESRRDFAKKLSDAFGFEVSDVATLEDAVRDAPIITLVTRAREPFLSADLLSPGSHLNAVGAVLPSNAEFTPDVFDRATILAVDSLENVQANSREFREQFGGEEKDWSRVKTLGEIISQGDPRPNGADLTLFKAVGMGISDLSVAIMAYERARERGIGRRIDAAQRVQPTWKK